MISKQARMFAMIFGWVYIIIALVELIFRNTLGGLIVFAPVHFTIHVVTGLVGLLVAYVAMGKWARLYAQVFGVIFFIVFLLGIFMPDFLSNMMGYPVSWLYNVVHLITGVWGIWAGFSKPKESMASMPSSGSMAK